MAPAEVPEMPSISQPGLLEQPIEHAPGEGAVRAAALQREVDQNGLTIGWTGSITPPINSCE